MGERDILAFKTLDVSHHFSFCMILVEHFVSQERCTTTEFTIHGRCFGYILYFDNRFFGCNAENRKENIQLLDVGCFVDTQTYHAIVEITQVHFLAQSDGTEFLLRNMFRQFQIQRIEEQFILLYEAQLAQCLIQISSDAMDTLGDGLDTFLTMITSIETSHGSEQSLSRTDIRCSLFALDMLFTSLQSHTIAKFAIFVFRKTDDTSRHVTLEFIAGSKVSSRWTTIEHWDTQTLSATEYNVGSPFTWRNEHSKRKDICIYCNLAISSMCLFYKFTIIFYTTVGVRILEDTTEDFRSKFQCLVIAYEDSHSLWDNASTDNGQVLWENVFVHEKNIGTLLLLVARAKRKHHVGRFGCCCCFIQQRAVSQWHSSQVRHGSLEVQ